MVELLPSNIHDKSVYDTSDIADIASAKSVLIRSLKQVAKYKKKLDEYNDIAYRYRLYLIRYCLGTECAKVETTVKESYSYEDDYGSLKTGVKSVEVYKCTTCDKTWSR